MKNALARIFVSYSPITPTKRELSANSKVTFEGIGFDINQFLDYHVKVYNEDFGDLIFEYEVTKIVYSDGTQE